MAEDIPQPSISRWIVLTLRDRSAHRALDELTRWQYQLRARAAIAEDGSESFE